MTSTYDITRTRSWTVDDYHRMIDAAILSSDDKVELLEGQIVQMSPQYAPHAATTHWASDNFRELLKNRATVRVQLPITLPPRSEPEPDIAIVVGNPRSYIDRHPMPADIFLLIEVADSTLESDRNQKATIYAQAGIREYWILDVNARQVYVHRQPDGAIYQQVNLRSDRSSSISSLAFPEISIPLSLLFPFED